MKANACLFQPKTSEYETVVVNVKRCEKIICLSYLVCLYCYTVVLLYLSIKELEVVIVLVLYSLQLKKIQCYVSHFQNADKYISRIKQGSPIDLTAFDQSKLHQTTHKAFLYFSEKMFFF